jgi:vesicle-fusing ATPase
MVTCGNTEPHILNFSQTQIQSKYSLHRSTRNSQQKAKLLDECFPGVSIDPILARLSDPTLEPGYVDPRHCLVFWGRPTSSVKDLINRVQQELLAVAPSESNEAVQPRMLN